MRLSSKVSFCALLLTTVFGCSVNVLETFADTTTNEALYADAMALVNSGNYTEALSKIASMTSSYAGTRSVRVLKASAYGGLCGFSFLGFVESLQDMGTTRLLPFLVDQFKNATGTRIEACKNAEAEIEAIGTVAERTTDENIFMLLNSLAKVGNVLSYYTDANQDGTSDVGTNVCTRTPLGARPGGAIAGDWYDSDLRELGTGLTIAIENITALGSSVNLGNSALTSVSSACTSLAGVGAGLNFCSITDPTAFTATHLRGILSLIKESSAVGLGTNCAGDVTTCNCP